VVQKPAWWEICINPDLQQFIIKMSQAFTKNWVIQEDLQQEAWLKICEFLGGLDARVKGNTGRCVAASADELLRRGRYDLGTYYRIADKAMDALYHREWRHWEKTRKLMNRLQSRQSRVRKKFNVLKRKRTRRSA